jgi:pyridinium-3,5-bisthiocarboxylic acid mononucleotide nickel chelatase
VSKLQGLHLHLEPTSGIAGDMAVAALVDAGVPPKVVSGAVAAMGVRGLATRFEKRRRGGFVGRGFVVTWPGSEDGDEDEDGGHHHHHHHEHHEHHHHHEHRDYSEIKRLIAKAKIEPEVRKLAGDIFYRIAEVEAELHGVRVAEVAFHEVGAYDSIADVVGVAAALAWLQPASVGSLPPVVGTGTARTAHGRLPVPAPATAELLRDVPILAEGQGELTTPTGAAILATIVGRFGPLPPLRIRATGYGAGTRELGDRPNVLRVTVGEPVGAADEPAAPEVTLVEANVDDMSPQLVAPLCEALLDAGAVDVWSTAIVMKKGRPALQVSALAPPGAVADVQRAFFRNSTTLGVRMHALGRAVLGRAFERVDTAYGPVRVKIGALDGEVLGAQPEFEDCRRLAARAKVPVQRVWAAASAAAQPLANGKPARRRRV